MTELAEELRSRTRKFAIRIVKLFRSLPHTEEARLIGKQLLRSGTSVAANYRAVCRARSRADFVSKMGVVVEESDENSLLARALGRRWYRKGERMRALHEEANELLSIFAASQRTARFRS